MGSGRLICIAAVTVVLTFWLWLHLLICTLLYVCNVSFELCCSYQRVYKLLTAGCHFGMEGHFVSTVIDKRCYRLQGKLTFKSQP